MTPGSSHLASQITFPVLILFAPKIFPFFLVLSLVPFFFQPACHLILYVCSQWLQPLYPGSHSIVTANVSFLKKKKNKCEDLS